MNFKSTAEERLFGKLYRFPYIMCSAYKIFETALWHNGTKDYFLRTRITVLDVEVRIAYPNPLLYQSYFRCITILLDRVSVLSDLDWSDVLSVNQEW